MKILVVCQYYYPEPFRITDVCETLVEYGHDVTVLTGLPNYPEGEVLEEYKHGKNKKQVRNGVNIIRAFEIGRGSGKLKLFVNYFSYAISSYFKALTIKEDFDVVLLYQLSPVMMAWAGIAYKNKHKIKMLTYCLDLWPDSLAAGGVKEKTFIYNIFFGISKRIYKSADKICVSSNMFKDYFKEKFNIEKQNIVYLPQYAEDMFSEVNKYVAQNGKFNFVFAGNIGRIQSVETIIYAANELKENHDIVFHIVGDGSSLEKCKNIAKNFNLENVVFYGRRPVQEMPEFYGMASAMMITMKKEKKISNTIPGKMQSYMAAGKPIIGAINGETKDVIEKSKCGICCDSEDFKSLAQCINEFISNKDMINTYGENSLEFYKENFSKESFFKNLILELEKLVN